jgi:hypothetical protein
MGCEALDVKGDEIQGTNDETSAIAGNVKIGYLVTGWLADSMAARIFSRLSASNSCP